MGFLSQEGHVGLKIQNVKGTYLNPGATGAAGTAEVQTLTRTSTGGTFTLLMPDGHTTGTITGAATVTAADVQNAIGTGEVVVTGSAGGPFTLTFSGGQYTGGFPVAQVVVNGASLTGGTVTAATTTQGVYPISQGTFMRVRSGAMGGNRELLIPDPEIGGSRDIPDAQLGPINFVGEYDFYARMESLALLLKAVLGVGNTVLDTPAANANTTTVTPGSTLPWVSVQEKIANSYLAFKYTDVKVNTLHLEAEAQGYLTGTCGLIGLTQADEPAPTDIASQRVDISPLLVGTNVTVKWNNVALPAKSFSIDINNNLEDDDFRLGSLFLGDLVEKRREITMAVTIRPVDTTLWKTAMWGDPAAVAPLGQSFKDDVIITVNSYEFIPSTTTPFSATFTIPKAIITPFELNPSGDDVVEHDMEIQAVRPDPAVPILTAVLVHGYDVI